MCAWCYAFQPELEKFLNHHPTAEVKWIMGGLAPDNNTPMDEQLRLKISAYWHEIEKKANVSFNHDYWELNTPYRSTYQACRAVISAEKLSKKCAPKMAKRIQAAYYLEAKNPSLEKTLINCASSIGLDPNEFSALLKSKETEQQLQDDLKFCHQLQVRGFPALIYIDERNHARPLTLGYCKALNLEQNLNQIHK